MCQNMYVMKLIDVFEDAKSILIVSEYLAGGDLYDYLDHRNFIISEARLRQIIYQVVLGLKYLHGLGIMHRDIKLENIMMSDQTDTATV